MNNWTIRWNFDKESYAPGESALISFWLENTNDTYLYISNLELEFDFGIFNLATIGGTIPPRTNTFLGTHSITCGKPPLFSLRYQLHNPHFYQQVQTISALNTRSRIYLAHTHRN